MDNNQPAEGQAIAVAPLPSSNMGDIQEQLRKMERMYQKACLEARQAQLRAEHAESLLETKQGILEGTAQQAEYERLMNESQQAKKEAKDSKKKCEALKQELGALKEQLDDFRRKMEDASRNQEKLEQENASLKTSLSKANEQLEILKAQFTQQQQVAHAVHDHNLDDSAGGDAAGEESIPAEAHAPSEGLVATGANAMNARAPSALPTGNSATKLFQAALEQVSRMRRESSEESDDQEWVISCICGQKEDDGEEMIGCDQCIVRWEHVECIFPRTNKVPSGLYVCHVCKPRPTELTLEQARAYQERVKMQKEEMKKKKKMQELADKAKRGEENSRNPSSVIPSHSAQPSTDKSAKSSFQEIKDNEYSAGAKRLVLFHFSHFLGAHAEMPKILDVRNNPKARSIITEPNIYGLVAWQEVSHGDYIAEILGYVCRPEECTNRDLVSGSLNDHTFLLGDLFVIDARKCGNFARNLRRSCKPNAELIARNIGDKLYIMIKAIDKVENYDEVSIKLEDDWKEKPRPAQGCGCKDMDTCDLERFFNQTKRVEPSSERKMKKPWPKMDYSLPSERKKPSAEDRKLQAMCERLDREKKRSGERKRGAINDANEDSDASIPVVSPPKKAAVMKEEDDV